MVMPRFAGELLPPDQVRRRVLRISIIGMQSSKTVNRFHQRSLTALAIACVVTSACGCAALNRPAPPTLDEIVAMSAQGMSDELVIARLRNSTALYRLSAAQVVELDTRGVSTEVIDYMLASYIEQELRRQRLLHDDPLWVHSCFACSYPYSGFTPFYFYP